ncbi:hypothetical protein B5E92_04350 [Erysipelatoclostridium sp. An15]|uniref:minor capsid protein n=1 Tax=Erysipelatoclostridium sp. An15 TaxID=1965566 RepID=UPI000B389FCE|nr:minor capsid protein [Erysipelatoclostridium sp. An15]OUQ08289.1 hypothetical protein B5E92_04350 [Erysipelatoclostridium sp. An15]
MSSYDYWKEREEAQRKKDNKDMKSYSTEIKKIYQNMMDQISNEIHAFYSKYASDTGITMAEAIKRANKLDMEEYSRKAKKYVEEKNFSEQANAEMKLYNMTMKVNRLELLKANIGLELVSGHDELEKFFQEELEGKTIEEIERLAGILGDSIQNNKEFAESIVNASFHNATFSDRIWMHQDLLKNDISSLLQTGLIQGRNPNVLARDLRKRFNVKISDAERLMRTEMARVQVDAQMRSYLANGIDEYEYIACGGSDVCSICRAMDGKIFKVSKMMSAKNAPPMHPNCHCSTGAHIDDKDYEDWLSFIESGGTTKEWNVQKRIKSSMGKQLEKLTTKEKEVLTRYTGNLAFQLNTALNANRYKKYQDEIDILDKALNKGTIPEDVVLRRKISLDFYVGKRNYSLDDVKQLIGTEETEKGYTSTSFNQFDDIDFKLRDGFIEFDVPKGYKGALYIKSLAYPKYKNQDEVLFARDLKYIIKDVTEENGIYYIKAEVIKND